MALKVVEKGPRPTTLAADMKKGTIVVESDLGGGRSWASAIEELQSQEARSVATTYAAQRGMGAARQNGNTSGAYPVNAAGIPLDELKDEKGDPLPMTDPRAKAHRYRIDVPVCPPLM